MDKKYIKAPFARIGGKHFQKKDVLKQFPKLGTYDIYVEPFMGAGNILLNAPIKKIMIGADTDTNIINFFNDIKKVNQEQINKLNFKASKKKFDEIKNRIKNKNYSKTPIERIYDYLYIIYNSYGAQGITYDRKNRHSTGITFKKNFNVLKDKLKDFKIIKSDFKDTINKYDSPTTFFYLDPPYYDTTTSGYETGNINHEELAELLRNIKGKFLLTHNDTPFIRKLYKGFKIKKYKSIQSIGKDAGANIVDEIFIKNY